MHERAQEARLQVVAAGLGRVQRQRGVQVQRPRRIVFDARVQCIEQAMRLADAQRRPDLQRSLDACKQRGNGIVQGLEAERDAGFVHGGAGGRRGRKREYRARLRALLDIDDYMRNLN